MQYRLTSSVLTTSCVGLIAATALGVIGPQTTAAFAQLVPASLSLSLSLSLASLPSGSMVAVDEPSALALVLTMLAAVSFLAAWFRKRRQTP